MYATHLTDGITTAHTFLLWNIPSLAEYNTKSRISIAFHICTTSRRASLQLAHFLLHLTHHITQEYLCNYEFNPRKRPEVTNILYSLSPEYTDGIVYFNKYACSAYHKAQHEGQLLTSTYGAFIGCPVTSRYCSFVDEKTPTDDQISSLLQHAQYILCPLFH